MATILVRDVPDVTHALLVQRATERGQSLPAFVLNVLERELGFAHILEALPGSIAQGSEAVYAFYSEYVDE